MLFLPFLFFIPEEAHKAAEKNAAEFAKMDKERIKRVSATEKRTREFDHVMTLFGDKFGIVFKIRVAFQEMFLVHEVLAAFEWLSTHNDV